MVNDTQEGKGEAAPLENLPTESAGASKEQASLGYWLLLTLGVAVPSMILLTFFHEFFYFLGFGVSITTVPYSPEDFLIQSLFWSPILLLPLIAILWEIITKRIELWQSEEEIIANYKGDQEALRKFRDSPSWLFYTLVVGSLVTTLLFGEAFLSAPFYVLFALGLSGVFFGFFLWLIQGTRLPKTIFKGLFVAIYFSCLFFTYMMLSAFIAGSSDRGTEFRLLGAGTSNKLGSERCYTFLCTPISERGMLVVDKHEYKVVRLLSQWVLAKDAGGEYYWVHQASDKKISITGGWRWRFVGVIPYFCPAVHEYLYGPPT